MKEQLSKAERKERIIKQEYEKLNKLEEKYRKEQLIKDSKKYTRKGKFFPNTPEKYKTYFERAYKKGIVFNLTVKEFNLLLSKSCHYCGDIDANGIDRIDSKIGYTKENSTPCCKICNIMKYTHTVEFFLNHIKKLYKFNNII